MMLTGGRKSPDLCSMCAQCEAPKLFCFPNSLWQVVGYSTEVS